MRANRLGTVTVEMLEGDLDSLRRVARDFRAHRELSHALEVERIIKVREGELVKKLELEPQPHRFFVAQ
jgi:hypothetical protein